MALEKYLRGEGGAARWMPRVEGMLAPLICLGFLVPVALSPGFTEADELNHFLIAREALHTWTSRVDIWGRPGCTLFFALATPLGLAGARLLAAVVTLMVCAGAVRLGRAVFPLREDATFFERHRDFFVFLFPFAFPAFLVLSASVMTEMLLACAWVWAAAMLMERRVLAASLLIAFGGLARPEGLFAIALWPVFLGLLVLCRVQVIRLRQIGWGALVAIGPLLAWYIIGAVVYGSLKWPAQQWPWQVHSQYGASSHRFRLALVEFAGVLWLPIAAGAAWCIARRNKHAAFFLLVPAAGVIALHGILGAYGLFGSLPMPRYFISIAAFLGILAVYGLGWASHAVGGVTVAIVTGLILMAGITFPFLHVQFNQPFMEDSLVIQAFPVVQYWMPPPMPLDGLYIDAAVDALPEIVPRDKWESRVVAFHPYARYRLGIAIQRDVYAHSIDWNYMRTAPVGTVVISDDQLCLREGLPQAREFLAWGYRLDADVQKRIEDAYGWPGGCHVYVWVKQR